MRWLNSTLALLGAATIASLANGCSQAKPCDPVVPTCPNGSGVTIIAHVSSTAANLKGGRLALCAHGECTLGTIEPTNESFDISLGTGDGTVRGMVLDEADGYSLVELIAPNPVRADDVYALHITAKDGTVLLDGSRAIHVDQTKEPEACPSDWACGYTTAEWYPSSITGAACASPVRCDAGVHFEATLRSTDTATPIAITACQNGVCGSDTARLPASSSGVTGGQTFSQLVARYDLEASAPGVFVLKLSHDDDTLALKDGDSYSLTVTQGTTTLASWSGAVTYANSFPNGACDGVACRKATITLP